MRALRNEVEEHIAEFRIIRGPGYHVDHDFNISGNQFIELAFKFLQRPSLDIRVELVNIQEEYSRNLLYIAHKLKTVYYLCSAFQNIKRLRTV